MAAHRIMLTDAGPLEAGARVVVGGEEGRHALRVKRLSAGQAVEVLDGRGLVARARVEPESKRELVLRVEEAARVEPERPRLEVWTATPKGARLDEMVRGLSQVGAAGWGALATKRGVVDPREGKLDRLGRIAEEACKQCGRAWVLEILARSTLGAALVGEAVVADASGEAYESCGSAEIRLLVGPEGGWTEAELATAREAGARVCSFGRHAMRIEVAAVVAAGVVMEGERRHGGREAQRHKGTEAQRHRGTDG